MKITIVGAGGQGSACASIAARLPEITEIRLLDADPATAEKTAEHIGSAKVSAGSVNALDPGEVAEKSAGSDAVIDMVLPWMATSVMKGALEAGCSYVNTAFDIPFWDELLEKRPLSLDEAFRKKNRTALLGCGMAPGFTNVVARYYAEKMDRCTGIRMRIGKKNIRPGGTPYDVFLKPWNPGWSPKQALVDCAMPPHSFENGEFVKNPPFSGLEECEFPEPMGVLPVTHHSHEEVYSMPRTFPDLKECNFKYYLMETPAILYSLGLLSEEEVAVGSVRVKPLDVVVSRIPNPAENFLAQTEASLAQADKEAFFEMIIEVSGEKDGRKITYKANCPKMNGNGPRLLKQFGTAMVNVALPALVGTLQIGEKPLPGVIFADQLDPGRFLEIMKGTGYDYQWKETVRKG